MSTSVTRSMLSLVAAGLVALGPGCGEPLPHDVSLEIPTGQTQPIINGAPASGAFYDAVVSLHQASAYGVSRSIFCSGTLITEDVVLTAAHCLDVGRRKVRTMSPDALAIHVGEDPGVDPANTFFAVSETSIHPGYDNRALLNDIALVRLASPVPASLATPIAHLDSSVGLTAADIGATLNFAGFGRDENGASGLRLEADGVLGAFGCQVSGCYGADDPATQISYNQYTQGPCFGDSGGPAFIERSGSWYVVGVTSWGDSTCSEFGVSTRTDAYDNYIGDFVGTPPPPPSCEADGICEDGCTDDPDCTSSGSCGDGVCGVGESCDGRGATSACGDCAGKVNGKPSARFCYVEGACEGPGC